MQLITTKGEVVRESVWDQVKDSRVDINNKLDTKHRLAQSNCMTWWITCKESTEFLLFKKKIHHCHLKCPMDTRLELLVFKIWYNEHLSISINLILLKKFTRTCISNLFLLIKIEYSPPMHFPLKQSYQ